LAAGDRIAKKHRGAGEAAASWKRKRRQQQQQQEDQNDSSLLLLMQGGRRTPNKQARVTAPSSLAENRTRAARMMQKTSSSEMLQKLTNKSITELKEEEEDEGRKLMTSCDKTSAAGNIESEESKAASLLIKRKRTSIVSSDSASDRWLYCQKRGCTFWTRKPGRMERHSLFHTPNSRHYLCPDCHGQRFYSLAKVLKHDRKFHTGVKDYECRVCEAEVTDIVVHMKVNSIFRVDSFGSGFCPLIHSSIVARCAKHVAAVALNTM
jgi:hypothetical protein